ncbi:MAG: type II toxin-antitoxin system RelE/ParE family toxin [Candidatus Tumulicola sp.]
MPRVDYSERALGDLNAIYSYITEDSIDIAEAVLESILDVVKMLERAPRAGRLRLEHGSDIRTVPVYPFIVFYRSLKADSVVQVLRVIAAVA